MQASAADYALIYFTTPKRQLVTSTVVGLATAKFKPLMLHWLLAESKSKSCYDRRPINQPVLMSSTHLGPNTRYLLLSESFGFVDDGRPLWREDGSDVYNCCWTSPAQSLSGPIPAGLMTTFYCLRFETPPNLEGQVPVFIPPGTGFPFRHLLRLAGLQWRYSNPPPRGVPPWPEFKV
jgi:hypothetical protein